MTNPAVLKPLLVTLGVGAAIWVPPLIDQLIRDPGNIRMLVRHFATESPEPAIGHRRRRQAVLPPPRRSVGVGRPVLHGDAFVHRSGLRGGNGLLGVFVFALWIAAVRSGCTSPSPVDDRPPRRDRASRSARGAVSMLRIFGKVWYYLTLWAWGTMLLVVASTGVDGVALVAQTGSAPAAPVDDRRSTCWRGVVVVCTLMSIGAAVVHDVPEQQLSDGLRGVLPATVEALDVGQGPAVGRDGRYLVFWQDAVFIGAQGYGLVNELERRGFDVGVHETWRVPVTPQRVFAEGTYDAEVHLVSGRLHR